VDFKKTFDSISYDNLWVTMMDMGYPLKLIDLLAEVYRKQLAIRSLIEGIIELAAAELNRNRTSGFPGYSENS